MLQKFLSIVATATPDQITAFANLALVITGVVAILFAWVQIRNERRYRRIENLENLIVQFDSGPIAKHRKSLALARLDEGGLHNLDSENSPDSAYDLMNFFEHVAFLVRKGHLDVYDVWHSFHYWASAIYCDLKAVIEFEQEQDPTAYCDFMWLFSKLEKMQKSQGGTDDSWTAEELVDFYKSEGADTLFQRRKRVRNRQNRKSSLDTNALNPITNRAPAESKR